MTDWNVEDRGIYFLKYDYFDVGTISRRTLRKKAGLGNGGVTVSIWTPFFFNNDRKTLFEGYADTTRSPKKPQLSDFQ